MTAASIRARVRAEMIDEIKAAARRHLATDGANLSLRAVARDLGMVSSAVYRYFASRDELLTALIIDAYHALGDAAERAEHAVDRADPAGRWLATCHAARDWALANPHEYALIYGSPVPGYRAPQETVPAATRVTLLLGGIMRDACATGAISVPADADPDDGADSRSGDDAGSGGGAGSGTGAGGAVPPGALQAELTVIRDLIAPGVPQDVLLRGMTAWIHLFGALSFELFGQLNNAIDDRRTFFDLQVRALGRFVGLPVD